MIILDMKQVFKSVTYIHNTAESVLKHMFIASLFPLNFLKRCYVGRSE